ARLGFGGEAGGAGALRQDAERHVAAERDVLCERVAEQAIEAVFLQVHRRGERRLLGQRPDRSMIRLGDGEELGHLMLTVEAEIVAPTTRREQSPEQPEPSVRLPSHSVSVGKETVHGQARVDYPSERRWDTTEGRCEHRSRASWSRR